MDIQVSDAHVEARVPPQYPGDAQVARIQGCVLLRALIGEDGKVKEVKAISGHPMLLRSAETAVKQWRYRPFLQGGTAIEVNTFAIVTFHLR